MRAIIFTVLLAGVYAESVPEEVPALDGTEYMRRTFHGPYRIHGCGSSSTVTSSSSSMHAIHSSSAVVYCVGGCVTAAPTNGALGNCPAILLTGAHCVPTCDTGYTLSGNHTCAAATGNVLQAATCTANPVASSSSANGTTTTTASAAASSNPHTTVTQVYTFPSLTTATYIGDTKGNMECAYANNVEAATTPTWCVAATGSRTYKSGIAMSSTVAARRAAKVTFTLKVDTTVLAKSALETKVATSSTAAKFAAALTAVNTGTGFNITDPGTATDVGTATFTSSTSGASSLLPSMLGLVSALFIAFKHM